MKQKVEMKLAFVAQISHFPNCIASTSRLVNNKFAQSNAHNKTKRRSIAMEKVKLDQSKMNAMQIEQFAFKFICFFVCNKSPNLHIQLQQNGH